MERGLQRLGEQGFLAAEVALDQGDVGAGLGGDVAQGRVVVAEARELRLGRLQDRRARGLPRRAGAARRRAVEGGGVVIAGPSGRLGGQARAGMTTGMLS